MTNGNGNRVEELEKELASLQGRYAKALMDLGFLQKATEHLNFHDNAHDGILYTDKNDNIIYANPYFLEMVGIQDAQSLIGKPIPLHFWQTPEDQEQLFKDVRQDGFVREREVFLLNVDRQPVFAMCSSVATYDEDKQFAGTEIMLCNITSKRKIQAELQTRTKQLERLFAFTEETVNHLSDMLQRNCSQQELLTLVQQLKKELKNQEVLLS